MDLWNRSIVAVTAVLAGLMLAAFGVAAFFGRYPGSRPAPDQESPGLPRRSAISRAPSSVPIEVTRLRRQIAYLNQELASRNTSIDQLTNEKRQLERQVQRLRRERDDSLGLLSEMTLDADALPTSEFPDSVFDVTGEESDENLFSTAAVNDSLAVATANEALLRAEVDELRTLAEEAQFQAETDLLEIRSAHQRLLESIESALVRIGPPAVPGLIAALESENAATRIWAADTLRALGPDAEAAINALELTRNDPQPAVRSAVEDALRAIRN